jgi:hypothetical protein
VFGWAALVAATSAVVFLLGNSTQSLGVCRRAEHAVEMGALAILFWAVCFVVLLVVVLVRFRGARIYALMGWVAGFLPVLLLLMAARLYMHSIPLGCPV